MRTWYRYTQCFIGLLGFFTWLNCVYADSSIYCPQNHAYISLGMTQDEVTAACGKPSLVEKSQVPFSKKVPMMQLTYNSQGSAKAFYGVWSLQVGVTTGSNLQIDVVNDKVYEVHINGESSKAFSICGGTPIVKGDPVGNVYSACGNPSTINNTYITLPISETTFPQVWIYELPYQASMRLTFVKGKLESID